MHIRLLYFKDCPNYEATYQLLQQVLEEKNLNVQVEMVEVNSLADAERYNFLGSPTIQINGIDIETDRQNDKPLLGCRFYKTLHGLTGVPPKHLIVKAIERSCKT